MIRSASVKLAAIYGLLFAVSAYGLVLFLWWTTTSVLDRQVEAAIHADAQGLADSWDSGGVPALVMTLQSRMEENLDDDGVYFLGDALHRRMGGNLDAWPAAVVMPLTFYDLPLSRDGVKIVAEVLRQDLPGGFVLLVGRDVRGRGRLKSLLSGTLLSSGLLVAGLAVAGSLVMRNLFKRMVSDVSLTAAAIARGELGRRVRRSGRGDEFDAMAEAINNMLERIVRLMDGVRQVSNSIAHDLRTPIARARARLEDAATHAASEAELRAALERAMADLDGVTSVFQALMRIAEVEAGAQRSAFAELDISTLLADLAELYEAAAEERGLSLVLRVPDTLEVFGDRDLIQQAVANLLDNAIKFSPGGGGCITLAAEAGASGQVVVTVADEGIGIPEADRGRVVERFFRGETARHTPGSGLGLALVQAVATLHDGSLVLEDARPGVRAVLRLAAGQSGRVNAASPQDHGAASGVAALGHS